MCFLYVGEKSNKNEVLIKKDSLDWLKGHLINRKKNSYQKYLAKMLAKNCSNCSKRGSYGDCWQIYDF